jgi:hypothetical protein
MRRSRTPCKSLPKASNPSRLRSTSSRGGFPPPDWTAVWKTRNVSAAKTALSMTCVPTTPDNPRIVSTTPTANNVYASR